MNDSIKNKIKVVIWDLDDTLWKGTLAEGDQVALFENRAAIIKTLNRRGIVNAICSKNNFDDAKAKLEAFGLFEEFVFPVISFEAKGPLVKQLLLDMGLRDANALFIDDNFSNLQEVAYYNPNISTLHADLSDSLLEHPFLKGKNDAQLERLQQYRVMQRKYESRKEFSSNEEFLKDSNIHLEILPCAPHLQRIVELTERTNQLNFTKNRMGEQELKQLLAKDSVESGCIHVSDRFGDHGVVGFYAIENGRLLHFLFSCRIMNLGVEQWVYAHLGYPALEIVGDVIAKVSSGQPKPSYITLVDTSSQIQSDKLADFIDDSDTLKTLLISTCDLETITKYLKKSNNQIKHERNFQYGGTTIINSGSQYIRNCFCLDEEKKREINEHIVGYGHPTSFQTDIFSDTYSYVVLSFQYDVILHHLIDRRDPSICIPDGGSFYKNNGDDGERAARERYIAENYETIPYIPQERFYDNVVWICEKMPENTLLFLLAIPEVDADKGYVCSRYNGQIHLLNQVIYQIAAEYPENVVVVPLDKIITRQEQLIDAFYHWSSETCFQVAFEVLGLMAKPPSRCPGQPLKKLPIKGRRLVILTSRRISSNALTLYDSLLASGVEIEGFVYSDAIADSGPENAHQCIGNLDLLGGAAQEYYVLVADIDENCEVLRELEASGYQMVQDFICDSSFVMGLNSTSISVAQQGDRFTFVNNLSAHGIEYLWAVADIGKFNKCLVSQPWCACNTFTFTVPEQSVFYLRAYIRIGESFEAAHVAKISYSPEKGGFVLDPGYHNPRLDAAKVEPEDSTIYPCVDIRKISVYQNRDSFTFVNAFRFKERSQFSYYVLDENHHVVLSSAYKKDNSFHFSAAFLAEFFGCKTLYIKAGIDFNGMRKTRIVSKIEIDLDSNTYTLSKAYNVNIVYERLPHSEDEYGIAYFGKDVFLAYKENRFTFYNKFKYPARLQYDWIICDAQKTPLYRTNFSDEPTFTTTLHENGNYYVQSAIRDTATGKSCTAFLFYLEYTPDTRSYRIKSYFENRVINKKYVLKHPDKAILCFRANDFSVCQQGERFTFYCDKQSSGFQFAYQLIDANRKKIVHTSFSESNKLTFTVPDCKLPLLVRGIVQYNGFTSARIISEIHKQADGSYALDDRYRIKRLPDGQAEPAK